MPIKSSKGVLETLSKTVVKYTRFIKKLILNDIEREEQLIGGFGIIVEVDEKSLAKENTTGAIVLKEFGLLGLSEQTKRKCL